MNHKSSRIVRSNEKTYPTTPTTPNAQQAESVSTSKASEASNRLTPNGEVDILQTPLKNHGQAKQKLLGSYKDIRLKRRRVSNGELNSFRNQLDQSRPSTAKLLMERSFSHSRKGRMANQRLNVIGEALVVQSHRATLRPVQLPPTVSCTIAVTMPRDDDDLIFATHGGDHTLTVSSHSTGKVVQTLMGHSRTPWTVAVHPADSSIVASGCLSGKVCLWRNYKLVETITVGDGNGDIVMSLAFKLSRRRTFDFVPNGEDDNGDPKGSEYKWTSRSVNRSEIEKDHDALYIACGNSVHIWCYGLSSTRRALRNAVRIQCICFTSPFSWGSLLTGSVDNQSGATISLWTPEDLSHINGCDPQQIIPRKVLGNVILYSEGGLCVSQCGGYLCAATYSSIDSNDDEILDDTIRRQVSHSEIVVVSLQSCSFGQVMRSMKLRGICGVGMTSIKFSPTDEHIVCGYGVSDRPIVSSRSNEKHCWAVYGNYLDRSCLVNVQSLDSREDDINVAIFHPVVGNGILYGTRQGPLRLLGS